MHRRVNDFLDLTRKAYRLLHSVWEGLKQKSFYDIHFEIRLTTLIKRAVEVERSWEKGYVELDFIPIKMVVDRARFC